MKKTILVILFLLVTTTVFAESYRTTNDGRIQRKSDLALIPINTANKDYQKYLEDVVNGAEVLPYDYEAEKERQKIEQEQLKKEKKDKVGLIKQKLDLTDKELNDLKEILK